MDDRESSTPERSWLPSSGQLGVGLLSAAPLVGYQMPKAMADKAQAAKHLFDTTHGDAWMLAKGLAGAPGAVPGELDLLAKQLEHRGQTAHEAYQAATHELAGKGRVLKGMGVGMGLVGAGLAGKGLYDRFHKEGAARALSDLGMTKQALGLKLEFDSPEAAQEHMRNRNIAGALGGGLIGAGIGGVAAGKRFGIPGALVGGAAGALVGSIPGRLLADVAQDYGHRTTSTYNDTMQRLNAAAGGNIRVAQDQNIEMFRQFAEEDSERRGLVDDPHVDKATGFELDQEKRERPPGFGPPGPLAGGDAGTRMMQIGLPGSGAT